MTAQNIYPLSLNGDTFNALKSDYDAMLRQTLTKMEDLKVEDATITVKVAVTLEKDQARDFQANGYDGMRDIVKPTFKHEVSSAMQVKDKKSGSLSGNYELVWDRESGQYFVRDIDDGQRTLFDDDEPEHVDLSGEGGEENGPRALPEAAVEAEVVGDGDTQGDTEDGVPDAAGEYEDGMPDPAHDPSKPFGWLRQFVGVTMYVSEAMGNYAVRTAENKVVLSSATSPENPFYCSAEKLAGHVGHTLVCVGYGEPDLTQISIECEECSEVLYTLDVPTPELDSEDEESEESPEDPGEEPPIEAGDSADADEDSGGGYDYDAPEE